MSIGPIGPTDYRCFTGMLFSCLNYNYLLKLHSDYVRQRALTLWEGFCVNARHRTLTQFANVFIIC